MTQIKNMLSLHGLRFLKESNKTFLTVYWNESLLCYISPDCQDNEYFDSSEITEFNPIKSFELNLEVESAKSLNASELSIFAAALNVISNYVIQLDQEWKGRDLKEFNSTHISIRR